MTTRDLLSAEAIAAFVADHPGWEAASGRLSKTFSFADYPAGLAFAVRVGFAAERRDHHPDLHVGHAKVTVIWSTHDAGGLTALDTAMAERTERLAQG